MKIKKICILLILLIGFISVNAQQNLPVKDLLLKQRLMSFDADTLIAPFAGAGFYFKNVRTGVSDLDAVNVRQLSDSLAANYGYDSLRFSITDGYLRGYNQGLVVDSTLFDGRYVEYADSTTTFITPTQLNDSLLLFIRWTDTTSTIATKYDLDTLTTSVYDSISKHTNWIYTLRDSVITNIADISSLNDSIDKHTDTLQVHRTDIDALQVGENKIDNNTYFQAKDYAGNYQGGWKITQDNNFLTGYSQLLESQSTEADARIYRNIPIRLSSYGDTLSFTTRIGGNLMFRPYVLSDGARGITDKYIDVAPLKLEDYEPSNTSMSLYRSGSNLYWNGIVLSTGASISGTAGYVPRFTGVSTLSDGTIRDDGTNVSVGGAVNGSYKFYTYGAGHFTGNLTALNLSGTNTGNVTLAGTPNYITISGQTITRSLIDLANDVSGVLPDVNVTDALTLTNITQITNRSHTNLSDIGSNTHVSIDSHIADITTNPHEVVFSDISLDNNEFLNSKDYAGNAIGLIKASQDNSTVFGLTPDVRQLYSPADQGTQVIAHMPIRFAPYGDSMKFQFGIGSEYVWKFGAFSDGAGGSINPYTKLPTIYLNRLAAAPTTTTDAFYNISGSPYFNGVALATGSSVSGTAGTVARFTGASTVGDGIIKDDGVNIGIGGAVNGSYKAKVYGALNASGAITGSNLSGTNTGDQTLSDLGGVPTSRTITTTAPLTGGGDLSANRTFAITQSGTGSNGYLSSTDWNTFNNKVSMVYPAAGIAVSTGSAWTTSITDNSTNWNTAYSDKINSIAFNTSDGILTATQQDATTLTTSLDGRYSLTSSDNDILNDTYFTSYGLSGSSIGAWKISKDNNFVTGVTMLKESGTYEADYRAAINSPIRFAAYGDTIDRSYSVGGDRVYTAYGVSDGAGRTVSRGLRVNGNIIADNFTGNQTVSSLTTNQLTVNDGSADPQLSIISGAITNGGTPLATGDQIYDFLFANAVTSVGLSAPTGFSVSGSPVTTTGTLAIGFASGYSLPTNTRQSTWDIAYNKYAAGMSFNTSTGDFKLIKNDLTTITQNLDGRYALISSGFVPYTGGTSALVLGYNITGERLLSNTHLTIGDGRAGQNPQLFFNGEDNDGYITFGEDEDAFTISDRVGILTTPSASYGLTVAGGIKASTSLTAGNSIFNDGNIADGTGSVLLWNASTVTFDRILEMSTYNINTTNDGDSDDWKTAFDWGDHATQGYVKVNAFHNWSANQAMNDNVKWAFGNSSTGDSYMQWTGSKFQIASDNIELADQGANMTAEINTTGINIPTGSTYKINGVDIGGGGSSVLIEYSQTILAAAINTLQSSPVELIASSAVGSGFALEVVSASAKYTLSSGSAHGSIQINLTTGTSAQMIFSSGLMFSGNGFSRAVTQVSSTDNVTENTALNISASSNSTGNGTLKVYITYRIITL